EVPAQTAEACLSVMTAAAEAARHGNPSALSDARTAWLLALAGLAGAIENVRINAREGDPTYAPFLQRAQAAWAEARTGASSMGIPLELGVIEQGGAVIAPP